MQNKKIKKEKGVVFNYKTLTIRGSFVNLLFTMTLIFLLFFGAFNEKIAQNLDKMAELIIAIYAISYGVWQGKKYFEDKNNNSESDCSDQEQKEDIPQDDLKK